jgi:serine/threonine-protein kinase
LSRLLSPGSRISGYEIVAQLKKGGMASFYLARRTGPAGFTKPVGIKVIHDHLAADREFVEMFLDEARLSAKIAHPNVVHVEELGESDGIFFLAMEYVHGASLSMLLRALARTKRRLAPEVACYIARAVADGLHAAHEATDERGKRLEVVHRDVSPQNVLVSAQGHVKLIDFGVAKAQGRLQETESGSIRGKLAYMSPEQAWGHAVDRRTDVYALGIVLWELLTGRRLIAGASEIDVIERARKPDIPPPSQFDSAINPALDQVVLTALAPQPSGRFDTAQAFRRALGNACPAALSIEPETIAVLLETELGTEMKSERALLETVFDPQVAAAPAPDEEIARLSTTFAGAGPRERLGDAHPLLGAEPIDAPIPPTVPHAIPETRSRDSGETRAEKKRPAEPPATAPKRPRSPLLWLGGAIVVLVPLAGFVTAWALGWFEPEPPLCHGIVRLTPADGVMLSHTVDTRTDASPAARRLRLEPWRNGGAEPAPSVLCEVVIPGTGIHDVVFTTAVGSTDPRTDTLVAVYPRACGEDMHSDPTFAGYDDLGEGVRDKRASGAFVANGGDVVTFVLTTYGGGGEFDQGVIQLDLTATPR